MASNGAPRPRHKKKLSFSTANIGASPSQGFEAASLSSPSQLVLGYSAGKLVRTPPVNLSSKIEDRESPSSPTPRSRLPSRAQPRARVNHPNRALGDTLLLSPFANLPPPFAIVKSPPRNLPNSATMVAGEVPAAAQAANPPADDWRMFEANLLSEAHNLPSRNPTAATAAQPISTSNSNEVNFDEFLNLPDDESDEEKEEIPPAQGPAMRALEPLLTTESEFPANTGANKEQWKAAVRANALSPNPFNLSMPDRAHRRSTSQGNQVSTTNTGENPVFGPSLAENMGPNFDVDFAEMMSTLENSRPGDLTSTANTGTHQSASAQYSSMGTGMGQDFGDMASNEFQMGSSFPTSMPPTDYIMAQENIMNTGNHASEAISTSQANMTDASLGSVFPSFTPMSQSMDQGNIVNNAGYGNNYGSGPQNNDSSSTAALSFLPNLPWQSALVNNQLNPTANMAESSSQATPATLAADMGRSSSQAAPIANMVGSSNQVPSTTADVYSNVGQSFMGGTCGNLVSAPGGFNMSFVPKSQSQMIADAFASVLGPDAQTSQTSQTPSLSGQSHTIYTPLNVHNNGGAPVYGHTPNNSLGSYFGRMSSQAPSSTNIPVQSMINLTRSATPNQSAINLAKSTSPVVTNTTVEQARSTSSALSVPGAPDTSLVAVSPNPLHPASFHQDTPRADTPLITVSPNPLHPASFHQPTPRAVWPTSRRPIPPNPAFSGNTPGYFQPGQNLNPQGNMNTNMHMQFPGSLQSTQQHQYNTYVRAQQNMQMSLQSPRTMQPLQPLSREYMAAYAAARVAHNEAIKRAMMADLRFARTPPRSPSGTRSNNIIRQRIQLLEDHQPLTQESVEDLRRFQLVDRIQTSLRGYNLNGPMPLNGRARSPPKDFLAMDPRELKVNGEGAKKKWAINLLTVVETFECDFCSPEKPNLYGIGPYNQSFVEIWGPAGHDWCSKCQELGKHVAPVAVPEKINPASSRSKKDEKAKGKAKRVAKESAGPGPSPKKPTQSSSSSSSVNASGSSTPYDRYAPMSEESNVFGDPQEIFSTIDNILINPFMHNLMCRGSDHRQIDMTKAKICERCKARKLEIITHGCHTEFSHIIALGDDGWQYGHGRGLPGPSQVDGSNDMNTDMNAAGFKFDVNADLNDGSMTLADINDAVNAGMSAGGMNSGMNSDMNADTEFAMFGNMDASGMNLDFDINFDLPGSNTPSKAPTTTQNPQHAHNHHIHMNGRPHGPISKFCMVCPAPSIFLCDGCPLTLCESCRYRLRDLCKGWFNNLIYTNGINHNRNDAFLLRSDNGGYHEHGKFWPVPPHVNL
ncbi:hypothetical protein SBOR_0592 [Sclerotinia borealis F-4128]|uniref:Uncharacterized protein n=1 Tax=Sclerotinia borealis (strain F-4128) TaxID=1432307 RepID=W9CSF8_SCLBF|nr:hypothetical protein SBOR_0592 [Sclerotinia borealis F-4128]